MPPIVKAYIELTKPRILSLVLVTSAIGYFLGGEGIKSVPIFFCTLIGTALSCGGAGVLNHYLERDVDLLMHRTSRRPLPLGMVSPTNALLFGIILVLIGTTLLVSEVNLLTGFLALLTSFLYVLVYTPLKRITWLNTFVGAIPGALPPVGGWTAATGSIDTGAWLLFFILFVWQIPHFYAIAWLFREDYARGGFKMLPVVEPDGRSTFRQVIWYSALLIPVSLLPAFTGMSGEVYFWGVLILSAWILATGINLAKTRTYMHAKKLLKATVIYLPVLLALIVLDVQFSSSSPIDRVGLSDAGIGDFQFVDSSEQTLSKKDLRGKVWVANFFFTSCPSVCPRIMGKIKNLIEKEPDLEVVSISVDPESDTLERLKEYKEKLGTTSSHWHLVRSSREAVKEFAEKSLKLGFGNSVGEHSTRLVLIDQNGNVAKYYSTDDEDVVSKVVSDLRGLR